MLHHIVFLNGARGDAACGGPERFFAAGEERAKMSLPAGYGYPLNPAAPWFLTYMYMNHRQITDSAFIEYKMTVAPASAGLQSVRSYWLDAGDCTGDPIYNVPGIEQPPELTCDTKVKKKLKGKKRKKAKKRANACRQAIATQEAAKPKDATHEELDEVVVGQSGRFVAGGGHVHGGAKELTMTKPACGDLEIAESTPTWGNPDHPFYNVKPILHEPGPIGMSAFKTPDRHPGPGRADDPAPLALRQPPAAHQGDGDHDPVPGARPRRGGDPVRRRTRRHRVRARHEPARAHRLRSRSRCR